MWGAILAGPQGLPSTYRPQGAASGQAAKAAFSFPAGASFGIGEILVGLTSSLFGNSAVEDYYANAQDPLAALRGVQRQNIEREAALQEQQAALALSEAGYDATATAREAHKFREEQALKYSSAGVLLTGSPMDVLEETRRLGAQEVQRIMARGAAQSNLLRTRAGITRNEGLAGLLGQEMAFNTQRTAARTQAAQTAKLPLYYALQGLGGLFRGKSYISPFTSNPNYFGGI